MHIVRTSLTLTSSCLALPLLTAVLCAQPSQQPAAAPTADVQTATLAAGESGVRIVRLSETKGEVKLDRKTEHGFEAAFANFPIVQGGRLQTGMGLAEVEFEDNSTLRVTPNSLVEFPVLKTGADGARITTVRVLKGAVYVSLQKNHGNNFALSFADKSLTLAPATHLLLDLSPPRPRLGVMDGSVQVTDAARTTTVGKKKGLLFDPADQAAPTLVASDRVTGEFDGWDEQSVDYHNRPVAKSFTGSSPYAYGLSDLSYYGNFASVGGCGTMWYPYLAGANFNPYGNGAWAYYPGVGYSFVSAYPWGWTPYHSGSWAFCPSNSGWGWQPNPSSWTALDNGSLPVVGARVPITRRPPLKPIPLSGSTVVPVHETAVVTSRLAEPGKFEFRSGSAGLGVPRGVFNNLGKMSHEASAHGVAVRPAYTVPAASSAALAGAGSATRAGYSPTALSSAEMSARGLGTLDPTQATGGAGVHPSGGSTGGFSGARGIGGVNGGHSGISNGSGGHMGGGAHH